MNCISVIGDLIYGRTYLCLRTFSQFLYILSCIKFHSDNCLGPCNANVVCDHINTTYLRLKLVILLVFFLFFWTRLKHAMLSSFLMTQYYYHVQESLFVQLFCMVVSQIKVCFDWILLVYVHCTVQFRKFGCSLLRNTKLGLH